MLSIDLQSQVSASILVDEMIDRSSQILFKEPHKCFRLGNHMTPVATTSLMAQSLHKQVGVADYSSVFFFFFYKTCMWPLLVDSPDRNVCSKEGSEGTKILHCTGETGVNAWDENTQNPKQWSKQICQAMEMNTNANGRGGCGSLQFAARTQTWWAFYVFNPSRGEVVQ